MGQHVGVLLGACTGRAGRKSGCKHRKSTWALLPECVTDGLSKQIQIFPSPSAGFNNQQAGAPRQQDFRPAPGSMLLSQLNHSLTGFSRASEHESRHTWQKPASQLHAGKNAAKLWDADNLAFKRNNYRVRLTEQQTKCTSWSKRTDTVPHQTADFYLSVRQPSNKHKPHGPKGFKLKLQLFTVIQYLQKQNERENKHFLPLAAPSPADWANVGSDQKTKDTPPHPQKYTGTNTRSALTTNGGGVKGRCCTSPSQTGKHSC